MTIGDKIRALRIERGLSQNELALACGYKSRASINKIELGKVDLPQSKIQLIAEALEVTPASLVFDASPPPDPQPVTKQARILAGVADIMPEADRALLLQVAERMFEKYFQEYERMDHNDSGL